MKQSQQPSALDNIKTFVLNACAGGVSAAVGKTVSAPMERVKLVLQTAKQNTQIKQQYNSGLHCFQTILKEEGVLSFWKGNLVNVIRYVPNQALGFAFKEKTMDLFKVKQEKNQTILAIKSFAAGGTAGSVAATIIYPLDFVRTRLAVDMGKKEGEKQFKGIIDCVVQVSKKEGPLGLYKGAFSNIISIFLYRGFYFGMYDFGKKHQGLKEFQSKGVLFKLCWAQFVTIYASIFAYPNDTLKRKMMMQSKNNGIQYSSTWDCCKKTIQSEGYQGLFKGFGFNCLRSVCGAICLVLFDEIQKLTQNTGKH